MHWYAIICIFGASVCLVGASIFQDPHYYLGGGFFVGMGLVGVLLALYDKLTDDQHDIINHFRNQNHRLIEENIKLKKHYATTKQN
jgi:hypothetical protein